MVMNEKNVKNWVTVSRSNVDNALKWAKKHPQYITNDYAVIGGRSEYYERGNDYNNFDFFFKTGSVMNQFETIFGVK
jgi:hypothetical protein